MLILSLAMEDEESVFFFCVWWRGWWVWRDGVGILFTSRMTEDGSTDANVQNVVINSLVDELYKADI